MSFLQSSSPNTAVFPVADNQLLENESNLQKKEYNRVHIFNYVTGMSIQKMYCVRLQDLSLLSDDPTEEAISRGTDTSFALLLIYLKPVHELGYSNLSLDPRDAMLYTLEKLLAHVKKKPLASFLWHR